MQPQLLTIIVIIVILYVIQNASNRIVKENYLASFDKYNKGNMWFTQEEYDEVNKLCDRGKQLYLLLRNISNHEFSLKQAQWTCQR
jgi:hypothetical protein